MSIIKIIIIMIMIVIIIIIIIIIIINNNNNDDNNKKKKKNFAIKITHKRKIKTKTVLGGAGALNIIKNLGTRTIH